MGGTRSIIRRASKAARKLYNEKFSYLGFSLEIGFMPVMRRIRAKEQVADILQEPPSVRLARKCLHNFERH